MPKYVIVRGIPGAGKLSGAELQGISSESNEVLQDMNRSRDTGHRSHHSGNEIGEARTRVRSSR